jgi:hypothetical protein
VKQLRSRVVRPAAVVAVVAAHVGIGAHVLGYWTIFGAAADGEYAVSSLTILIATVLPMLPFGAAAALLYRIQGARLRRAWCDEFSARHGLSRAVLEQHARRYG